VPSLNGRLVHGCVRLEPVTSSVSGIIGSVRHLLDRRSGPRSMYPSLTMRLREGLLHQARGGHDHLTSTTMPASCTIKPLDAGSRQCPWVTALLTKQLASSTPSGSWPKLTPTGQHAWRDTNRSSAACSNAFGRTDSNRSATRSPGLLIRSYWRAPARLIEIQRGPHVGGGRCQ
jgi:hypothetical protein